MNLLEINDTDCNILLQNKDLFNKKNYFEEPNSAYKIISISLQEVNNIDEFKNIIDTYLAIFSDTYIRIYTNKECKNTSIDTFIEEFKNKKYIQIVEYEYILLGKQYINHLIKYEPLFNFEEVTNINFVQILDPNTQKINVKGYEKFIESDTNFYFSTSNSNYLNKNLYSFKDFSPTWCRINPYGIMSKVKFPCYIYNNFVKMLSNTINKDNQFTINDVTQMYYEYFEIYKNNEIKGKYEEIMLYVLMNYISLFKINYSYYFIPNFTSFLTHLKNNKCSNMKTILKNILKKDYDENKNIKNNYYKLFNELKSYKNKNFFNYSNNLMVFVKLQFENDMLKEFCMNEDYAKSILIPLYISFKPKDFIDVLNNSEYEIPPNPCKYLSIITKSDKLTLL